MEHTRPQVHDVRVHWTRGGRMKNITLSADERDIEAARERAREEQTTLNEAFRRWIEDYGGRRRRVEETLRFLDDLATRVKTGGRKFTREELNER
jgi:uncharacterized protein with ParB-like and HNH nuclease domain